MWLQRVYGYWIAEIFLSLFWKDIGCDGDNRDYTIAFRSPVSVNEGACVVIPCTFTINRRKTLSPNAVGLWLHGRYSATYYYYCSVTGVSGDYLDCSEKPRRFRLNGNLRDGDCSLAIYDASEKDRGYYIFRLEDGDLKWTYYNYLNVNVIGVSTANEYKFSLNVQERVTVQEGLCATIPCAFTIDRKLSSSSAVGYWRKTSIGPNGCYDIVATNSQSDVSANNGQKFQLTGNPSDGDCTLTISNVSTQDTGLYQFRFEQQTIKWSYRDRYLHLDVTAFTEAPNLSLSEIVVAGQEVTLTCSPPGIEDCTGTARVITWERKETSGKGQSDPIITCGITRCRISKCSFPNITFTPSESDNGASYICNATFPALGKPTHKSVTLNVQYPPSNISIAVEPTGNDPKNDKVVIVKENDNVTLTCTAKSNPPSNITWGKRDTNIPGEMLQIQDIRGTDAGTYICSAQNQHGNTRGAVIIIVLYRPTISITIETSGNPNQTLESLSLKEGDSLTLMCRWDGHPAPNVSYAQMGGADGLDLTVMEKTLVLRLMNITFRAAGIYNFSASNSFGSTSKSINISVQHSLGRQEHKHSNDLLVSNQIRDIIISAFCGLLCGIGIALCITSLISKRKNEMKNEDVPANTEEHFNDLYMNISSAHQSLSTSVGNRAEDEPTGTSTDQGLHYASINFPKQAPNPRHNTSETLYSEIKKTKAV